MIKKELDRILPKIQKPARYTGGEINCYHKDLKNKIRYAICFPDTYEVGMSHLGLKIIYELLNSMENVFCERAFAPWPDMEQEMRDASILLYALETKDNLSEFDFIGFTLQYELSYTNVLNMLDLANIPLRSAERGDKHPIIMGGGPCAVNAEPVADFFDLLVIGEAEEVLPQIINIYSEIKKSGGDKNTFLENAVKLDGVYVPSFYDVTYKESGIIESVTPNREGAPIKIKKTVVKDIDNMFCPERLLVPLTEVVHDRIMLEIFRGCIRGCRFCQAGMIYRPVREKSAEKLLEVVKKLYESTGYEEISLTSLSTSDYTQLEEFIKQLLPWAVENKINISLPSLRIDNFPKELLDMTDAVRKSGLTFAPEAGTARLRDAINKNITEDDILGACEMAFKSGRTSVKLYFMIGLPTETKEDILGIATLSQRIVDSFYHLAQRPRGKSVQVSVSLSTFVPKPFTPFQWEAQDSIETILEKQKYLRENIRTKKISLSWHDSQTSMLEAAFARGDRRLSNVIEHAWKSGCKFDSWSEYFKFDNWLAAFEKENLSPEFYANRKRDFDEVLPWDHIDTGVTKKFLIREAQRAYSSESTKNCRQACSSCGAASFTGGICNE